MGLVPNRLRRWSRLNLGVQRSSRFARTHAARYTLYNGATRDEFGQRQLWVCDFGQLVFGRSQIFGPFAEIRKEKTKWMNLVLEKVESPGSQRTAVILVSRGVTLLVYGFGQLVFVMPQTFGSFTETRNEKTKWMNLLLEKVESPGSQRTSVILGSRGVTLPDTLFRYVLEHLPINTPPLIPNCYFFYSSK